MSAALAGILFVLLVLPSDLGWRLLTFGGIYILPFGMDVAVPGAVGFGMEPWQLLLFVFYFDTCISLFLIWNLDHAARWERIRRIVDRTVDRAERAIAKRPWLGRATVPGLALFIFLPLLSTGTPTGIVLGKLIGMRPLQIYAASILGTSCRVALLAFGTHAALAAFRNLFGSG